MLPHYHIEIPPSHEFSSSHFAIWNISSIFKTLYCALWISLKRVNWLRVRWALNSQHHNDWVQTSENSENHILQFVSYRSRIKKNNKQMGLIEDDYPQHTKIFWIEIAGWEDFCSHLYCNICDQNRKIISVVLIV